MTEPTPQRPPYEDTTPAVDLGKGEPPIRPVPVRRPQAPPHGDPQPGEVTSQTLFPDIPQPWTEARIMRLAASFVATVFIIGFVIMAARVLPWELSWLPFLIGALPYVAFAGLAWRKHLDDESASRKRRENFAHSRFDAGLTPLADQPTNTERWP